MVDNLKPPAGVDVFVVCTKDKGAIEYEDFIALGKILYETFLRSAQDAQQINRVLSDLQKTGQAYVTTNKSIDIIDTIAHRTANEMNDNNLNGSFEFIRKKAVTSLPKHP
jgi:hypothetical protein